jgi:hypothetical protein
LPHEHSRKRTRARLTLTWTWTGSAGSIPSQCRHTLIHFARTARRCIVCWGRRMSFHSLMTCKTLKFVGSCYVCSTNPGICSSIFEREYSCYTS